ncbi:MAG: hypothetical protein R3F62_23040 [Planctomycetota bacterium]
MPETVMATYRVHPDHEPAFRALLARHVPTLRGLGLATDTPAQVFRHEEDGRPVYVEVFDWTDAQSARTAHETPQVMAIWEPMGELVEARGGRPSMEFPHVARVTDLP